MTDDAFIIRRYAPTDADAVVALNQACMPEVGPLEAERLAGFESWAPYFKVGLDRADNLQALIVGLTEDAPYGSPNFGWFVDNYPLFAYVDRIAVDVTARGAGWGPELYRDFERWAVDNQRPMLCAEVNLEPPNPRSLRFHQRFGFEVVAEFEPTGSPDYRVALLVKNLD